MKGQIIYTPELFKSKELAEQSLESFKAKKGWDLTLQEGITRNDLKNLMKGSKIRNDFNVKFINNGRLWMMRNENDPVWETKEACVFNHLYFWKKVVDTNETMCFIEHDVICNSDAKDYKFDEYLILNMGDAFTNKKYPQRMRGYCSPMKNEYNNLENDPNYPLVYNKSNLWEFSYMVPGTAAYAITPTAAKKMLNTALSVGIDQSDFILNTHNLKVQYVSPSPVSFNKTYLSTSWGL